MNKTMSQSLCLLVPDGLVKVKINKGIMKTVFKHGRSIFLLAGQD